MSAPRYLITGADGFVGSHVVELLLAEGGYEVHATAYSSAAQLQGKLPADHIHQLDLSEQSQVENLIKELQPDGVFHFAAIAVVGSSFSQAQKVLDVNHRIQFAMLEALRLHSPHTRLLSIGSAAAYGLLPAQYHPEAIQEEAPFYPSSPYAVSKIDQEYLALSYHLAYGLNIVRVRPFNQIGPRQSVEFAVPAFAEQVARAAAGLQDEILVGNLESTRDFTDVRDAARAYLLLMEKGASGEVYNLGSGTGVVMRSILDQLCQLSGHDVRVTVESSRLRPVDVPIFVADASRLHQLGWKPQWSLIDSLRDILNEHTEQVTSLVE